MENDFLIPIGKRIAEVRRSHNVTQEKLADKLGVSPKHVSHTECGTSSLSLKNLIEFCNLFNCSLDYIIFGQSGNKALSKLPDEISKILCTGSDAEIDRLNRYLQIYIELLKEQD
jgi:transcriptional regulator with XRE-family HTH domain